MFVLEEKEAELRELERLTPERGRDPADLPTQHTMLRRLQLPGLNLSRKWFVILVSL